MAHFCTVTGARIAAPGVSKSVDPENGHDEVVEVDGEEVKRGKRSKSEPTDPAGKGAQGGSGGSTPNDGKGGGSASKSEPTDPAGKGAQG